MKYFSEENYKFLLDLENITFFYLNNYENIISVSKLWAIKPEKKFEYQKTYEDFKQQIYFLIVNLIKKIETDCRKNKKWQEIYECWIKPFCDAFRLEKLDNIDSPIF